MKKGLKILLIVIAGILVLGLAVGGVTFMMLNNASNVEEYTLGGDTIKSVKAVVEKRKVTSMGKELNDGVHTEHIHYQSESVQQDLNTYVRYLLEEGGFVLTKDMDLNEIPATIQMGKESVDQGEILLLTIDYDVFGYTITVQKGKGTLTIYD